jgi:MFS transporter, ACS family, hexuronate transporter
MAVAVVLLLPAGTPLVVWFFAAVLLGLTVIGFQGLWLTMLAEVSDPQNVGASTGFAVMCTIGAVTATPPLFGAFADWLGTYRAVWLLLIGVLLVAILPVLRLQREPHLPPAEAPAT